MLHGGVGLGRSCGRVVSVSMNDVGLRRREIWPFEWRDEALIPIESPFENYK